MVECLPVNRIELLQGTLDLMILQTLRWGPQHGHGIGQAIRASSQDAIQVEHGSLYPALHRLERRGWLAAESAGNIARAGWLPGPSTPPPALRAVQGDAALDIAIRAPPGWRPGSWRGSPDRSRARAARPIGASGGS